jgi:hypothetical protein
MRARSASPLRSRRLRRAAGGACALALSLSMLAWLAFFALDTSAGRARWLSYMNTRLAESCRGRLTLVAVDHVGLFGAEGLDATLDDPRGKPLASVKGADIRYDLAAAAYAFLFERAMSVRLASAHLERAELQLPADSSSASDWREAFEAAGPVPRAATFRLVVEALQIDQARWLVQPAPLHRSTPLEIVTHQLSGRLDVEPQRVDLVLSRADVETNEFPRLGSARGTLSGSLRLGRQRAPAEGAPELAARFEGSLAEMPVSISVRSDAPEAGIELSLQATPSARAVSRLLPALVLTAPLELQLKARGEPADIQLQLALRSGAQHATATGRATLQPTLSMRLSIEARDIDLGALRPELPKTALHFDSTLSLEQSSNGLTSELRLELPPVSFESWSLPATLWTGRFYSEAGHGTLGIEARGIAVQVDLVRERGSQPPPESDGLRFDLHARLTDLGALRPDTGGLGGNGTVEARGTLALTPDLGLNAEWNAQMGELTIDPLRLGALQAAGRARGSFAALQHDMGLQGSRTRAYGRNIPHWRATVRGTAPRFAVALQTGKSAAFPEVRLAGSLDSNTLALEQMEGTLGRGAHALHSKVGAFRIVDGVAHVEGLRLRGAGQLDANARIGPSSVWLEAAAKDLDLFVLGQLANGAALRGLASFEADLRLGATAEGHLTGNVRELGVRDAAQGQAMVDLQFVADGMTARVAAELPGVGQLQLDASDLVLPRRWADMKLGLDRGTLALTGRMNLRELRNLNVPLGPLSSAEGELEFDLESSAGAQPSTIARIATRGVEWQPSARPRARSALTPRRWLGVRSELVLSLDRSGLSNLRLRMSDAKSPLLSVVGRAQLPALTLGELARLDARQWPFVLELDVPEGELGRWPVELRPDSAAGRLGGRLSLEGPLSSPKLDATLGFEPRWGRPAKGATKFSLAAHYGEGRGWITAAAASAGARVLNARADAEIDLARVWREGFSADKLAKVGSASADVTRFPLHLLRAFGDGSLDGFLDGHLELTGLGVQPKGSLIARVTSLTAARLPGQRLGIEAVLSGAQLRAKLEFEQPEGTLVASLDSGFGWSGVTRPRLEDLRDPRGEIVAREFQVAVFQPWLANSQRELGGIVSAHLGWTTRRPGWFSGPLNLRDGVFEVSALGQAFRDVRARFEFLPDGLVRVGAASARAAFGRMTLAGEAHLQGLAFRSGALSIGVEQAERIPITLRGIAVGTAWGEGQLTARAGPTPLSLEVTLPKLHLELRTLSPPNVQELEADETILTGTYRDDGVFVAAVESKPQPATSREGPAPVRIHASLGQDVWLHRGQELEARASGELDATLDSGLNLVGSLALAEGHVDLQGRQFELLNTSTITFPPGGDPYNPVVFATGRWNAPEGFQVYASFVGPVDSGEMTLQAEPALDRAGIMSLLMFGTADGQFGISTRPDAAIAAATALGNNNLVRGLDRELEALTSLEVQTRLDSSGRRPHPEVAFQLSPRLTAEVSYDLGAPSPGESPDTTFLTLDLRLRRNWSVSTTVGDQGSTFLDLSWRYRY